MNEGTECDCPLCRTTFDEETDLRVHLMVDHRKSDVTKHLVGLLGDREALVLSA